MASQALQIPHGPARSAHLLQRTRAEWRASGDDLLLFAYGSLIWRPDFTFEEALAAKVLGFHRVLRMRSRVNRGSPQEPGLVLALVSGGSCRGLVYRVRRAEGEEVLDRLWAREMPNGVYEPRWLNCDTPQGRRRALAFTLSRRSPNWTGELHEPELLHIFQHASGRYGSTLDYLLRTVQGLRAHGIRDLELERQAHLAARHGLCAPLDAP
jgi:cation transport protein ChaC